MNGRDILRVAHELQDALDRETPPDLKKAKADIRKLAEVVSNMCDLHEQVNARLERLEQIMGVGPTGLIGPPH